jgi:UDP-2,3-diacylglucosamine pyrophosphatase LpxH
MLCSRSPRSIPGLAKWLFLLVLAPPAHADIDIWSPRQHCPMFLEPGGAFVAEVRGPAGLPSGGWTAMITNELRSWACNVSAPTYGSIRQGKENGWQLTINAPADIPPELFGLIVSNSNGGVAARARAVKVISNFEESFYILQQTDQHVGNEQATQPDGKYSSATASAESVRWAAPVINLINPRFVLMTGDNVHIYNTGNDWVGWKEATNRIKRYFSALQTYDVATVMTDGNHDIGYSPSSPESAAWRVAYEDLIGQRVFSRRLGSFYVLCNELTFTDYLSWARADYNAAFADPTVKYRLIGQHHVDNAVAVAFATNACDLMVGGHTHTFETYQMSPYPIHISGSSKIYQQASFYDFRRTANDWTCSQATHHLQSSNYWRLFGDWGNPGKVSATFGRPNDGSQISNSVDVINNLPQTFYHGRVKFLMARGAYTATGGEVEAQYDYANGTKSAVLVKVNLAKNAITQVSVKPRTPQPPSVAQAAILNNQFVLGGTGHSGDAGLPYYILSSTNAVAPLAEWRKISTNYFAPDNSFRWTNTLTPGESRRFLRLQVPY